ncbi:hypothetical protein CKA32_001199 [Geitlerinema sp. FC II]|nr:hypothetical protein CKA32_001199 [Geitlerinema sp. FC II]
MREQRVRANGTLNFIIIVKLRYILAQPLSGSLSPTLTSCDRAPKRLSL